MYKGKNILCIIPARAGSKGLPKKNIKKLYGKPLISYTIKQAISSRYIDRVIVSTDDKHIAAISRRYGADTPFLRPRRLSSDTSGTIDVLLHAVNWMEKKEKCPFYAVVLLQITSPLRNTEDIDNCIRLLFRQHADSVFSVTKSSGNPYFNMVELQKDNSIKLVKRGNFLTRQQAPPVYDINGAVYAWKKGALKSKRKTILNNSRIYVMPKERSVDIDDEIDFETAKMLCKRKAK